MLVKRSLLIAALIALFSIAVSADVQQTSTGSVEVTLSTELSPREVPLNLSAVLLVRIMWQGEIDQIEIETIDEPVLTNFEIIGTASSNKVEDREGVKYASREITYTLTPTTLGMAYVESVTMSYKDMVSGKTHHLRTQRVGAKGISPKLEPGKINKTWLWIVIPLLLLAGGAVLFLLSHKQVSTLEEVVPQVSVEEKYLQLLKEQINLETSEPREAFTRLSRLFRNFLADKFGLSALEATTAELLEMLAEKGLDEKNISKCGELFNKADHVKFSGQNADLQELRAAFTTVESFFEKEQETFFKQ